MTDFSLVSNELKLLLGLDNDEVDKYERLVEYAVQSVKPLINEGLDENDVRIVHLCAAKAYYQIAISFYDGLNSFKAGDVSFTADASFSKRAKELLDEAYKSCSGLLKNNNFAFEVM